MGNNCEFPRIGKPCPSCPWRVDQDAQNIPNFDIAKAEVLAECCPDSRGFGPSFGAKLFACHQSNEGEEFACAGWLSTVGHAHPNVRLAVMTNRLPAGALRPGPGWPELHQNYGDVLVKLRTTAQQV